MEENCTTCELIETGGIFIDAECEKHRSEFNRKELSVLKDIVEEWLSEGFVGISSLNEIHYSIIKKLDIKVEE